MKTFKVETSSTLMNDHLKHKPFESKGNGVITVPKEVTPNQYLTTDENGDQVWEDRLAYTEEVRGIIASEQEYTTVKHWTKPVYQVTMAATIVKFWEPDPKVEYEVTYGGAVYNGKFIQSSSGLVGDLMFGNGALWTGDEADANNAVPFAIHYLGGSLTLLTPNETTVTVMIQGPYYVHHSIKAEYTGVHYAKDKKSVMFGDGFDLPETGEYSFTTGHGAIARGVASFAHGCSGARGEYSVGLGGSTAIGKYSVSSGMMSTAEGNCSFASGYGTTANSTGAAAFGKFNVPNENVAFAVGNGDFETKSNAYTLDWNGNAWFAGTMEGAGVIVKSSTSGSNKKFKITVDDSGNLSATEVTN